jgi:hypothetical protein
MQQPPCKRDGLVGPGGELSLPRELAPITGYPTGRQLGAHARLPLEGLEQLPRDSLLLGRRRVTANPFRPPPSRIPVNMLGSSSSEGEAARYAPRTMARVLDRLPPPHRNVSSGAPRTAGARRVPWGSGDATTAAQLRAALELLDQPSNGNPAGRRSASDAVDDIQRYAATFAIELTDDQVRGVLERCGWLTYAAPGRR